MNICVSICVVMFVSMNICGNVSERIDCLQMQLTGVTSCHSVLQVATLIVGNNNSSVGGITESVCSFYGFFGYNKHLLQQIKYMVRNSDIHLHYLLSCNNPFTTSHCSCTMDCNNRPTVSFSG